MRHLTVSAKGALERSLGVLTSPSSRSILKLRLLILSFGELGRQDMQPQRESRRSIMVCAMAAWLMDCPKVQNGASVKDQWMGPSGGLMFLSSGTTYFITILQLRAIQWCFQTSRMDKCASRQLANKDKLRF